MSSDELGPEEPRGAGRRKFDAEVRVRRSGMHGLRVRLFDASPEGCKIEFIDRPEIGERIWIKFDNVEAVEGIVRWIAGTTCGIQFERPFHDAVFERLAAASKSKP